MKVIAKIFLVIALMLYGNVFTTAKVIKILAIGNSFSQDAVEQNLHELAASEGIQTIIGNMYIGGCSIDRHVKNLREDRPDYYYRKVDLNGDKHEKANQTLEEGLQDEQWDYVSVQQASSFSGIYKTYALLPELIAYVRKYIGKNTKLMFHQTWAYAQNADHTGFQNYDCSQMKMYGQIVKATRLACSDCHIPILIPCGTAIQNMRTSFVGDNMNRDGYHLQLTYGRYAAACTWFEIIFKKNVIGNTYVPNGLNVDLARVAQMAAHAAVENPDKVTSLKDIMPQSVLYKDSTIEASLRAADLVKRMTLKEKILQLNQYTLGRNDNENNRGNAMENIPAEIGSLIYFGTDAEIRNAMQKKAMSTRLGIPIIFGFDVIHGFKTIFPIPLAQACSWNPHLVRLACSEAAKESKLSGIDWTFAPMIDISRDPRWGRIAESFGEDPYVNGVFGEASVRGYQGRYGMQPSGVVACLKHYVGYGASEAGRDYVYTEISRQSLWDTYLQPFYHGVKAGALTVMSSFNNISGIPSSANHYTMTDVLKDRFKFKGFIVSDWGAVKQLKNQGMAETPEKALSLALNAGLDMDMMSHCYDTYLEKSINEGKIDISVVDKAVERVLYVKFKAGLFEHPFTPMKNPHERFFQKSAMDLESQLAAETMVLLKNDSLLPLINHKRIAIIGPLVKDSDNLLGTWAAHGDPNDVKTLFDGFCKEFNGTAEIRYAKGCNLDDGDQRDFPHAIKIAKWSDVIVLCLGEKRSWSGENASRASINLPSTQIDLLKLLRETGKPIVVVLSNGRPLQLDVVEPLADAILEIWQPGINGADAFAGILSGRINPSGRLSVTFPYSIGQIPIYYSRRKSGRNGKQGVYKDTTSNPLFPFGYGLSYSDFKMGDISISSKIIKEGEQIKVSVPVSNVGNCDGMQTVFWYISDPYCSITRPEKELKFFEKKLIAVGTTETYTFNIDVNRDLSFINADGKSFLEEGEFNIMANDKSIKIYLEK